MWCNVFIISFVFSGAEERQLKRIKEREAATIIQIWRHQWSPFYSSVPSKWEEKIRGPVGHQKPWHHWKKTWKTMDKTVPSIHVWIRCLTLICRALKRSHWRVNNKKLQQNSQRDLWKFFTISKWWLAVEEFLLSMTFFYSPIEVGQFLCLMPTTPRSRMSTGPPRQSTSWSNDGRCWSPVRSHPPKWATNHTEPFGCLLYSLPSEIWMYTLHYIYRIYIHIPKSGGYSQPQKILVLSSPC